MQYNTVATSDTSAGTWLSLIDEKGYVFIALVNTEYSSRLTTPLLYQMKTEFYKCNPVAEEGTVDASTVNSEFLIALANRYNDPSQWDKLTEAQNKVNQVKGQLQANLRGITVNRDQMMVRWRIHG